MSVTVFLADDHAVLREGLRLLLSSEPEIEVVGEAANGREAVERVPECYPDVVIMDIAMPEMNGIEAARQIADLCPDTRVLVLSMYSSSEHILRAAGRGARIFAQGIGGHRGGVCHSCCLRRTLLYGAQDRPPDVRAAGTGCSYGLYGDAGFVGSESAGVSGCVRARAGAIQHGRHAGVGIWTLILRYIKARV